MVNVLIVDDDIYYATTLMNYLNKNNESVRVCGIITNGKDAIQVLNMSNNIDVVLLDYKLPIYDGKQIIHNVKEKSKYENSIIVVSGAIEEVRNLYNEDTVYSIMYKTFSMDEIVLKINELLNYKETLKNMKKVKEKVINEMLYLRYNFSYKGTQYLVRAIEYSALNKNLYLEKLERDVYPIISKEYNDTIRNIKCNINRANNSMYLDCEVDKLKKYFSLDKDTKPKIKTVINTIVNKISKE